MEGVFLRKGKSQKELTDEIKQEVYRKGPLKTETLEAVGAPFLGSGYSLRL